MQFFKPYGMRCGTDNFGISDGIDEISVEGTSWILNLQNSMKIH